MLCVALAWCAEPPSGAKPPNEKAKTAPAKRSDQSRRVTVAVARDRAKLAHRIYESALRVMHHRYFHGDKAVVPARAMEDVFFDIAWQEKLEAKWISVNTAAMSLEHEPKSEFEKRAAKEIAKGKDEYEAIEEGYYRRAGVIPLGGGMRQLPHWISSVAAQDRALRRSGDQRAGERGMRVQARTPMPVACIAPEPRFRTSRAAVRPRPAG